jgi:hypothetical protein
MLCVWNLDNPTVSTPVTVFFRQSTAALLLLFCASSPLQAALIAAGSAARDDVAAAVDTAVEGDTVFIPSGMADWTNTLTVSKAITLRGAGIGKTIILDDIISANNNFSEACIVLNTSGNALFRVSDLEVRSGTNRTTLYYNGCIQVIGTGLSARVDRIKIDSPLNRGVYFRQAACGVIDHCVFNTLGSQAVFVEHQTWGGAELWRCFVLGSRQLGQQQCRLCRRLFF